MRSRRAREMRSPGLLVGLALAGCAVARAPVELTAADLRRAASGGEVLVLARFHRADTGDGIFVGGPTASVPAMVTHIEDGRSQRFGTTTASAAAGARGWVLQPLTPGEYYMTLGAADAQAQGRAFTFTVPAGAGAVHVGAFPFNCPYTDAQPCQSIAAPVVEPEAAHPPLPGGGGPAATRLAERFDLAGATRNWPAPSSMASGIDSVAVQSAINWEDFAGREGSRGTFRVAGGMAELGFAAAGGGSAGAIIAAPFFAAALGTVAVGGLVAGAEAIHRSAVEREWRPCLEALNGQMAPATIGPRLAGALAVPPPMPTRRTAEAPAATPWRIDVTRVVLRRCAEPGEYAVEVATRFTAPGREARFLRRVAAAPALPGLAFPERMPWEAEAGGAAPCRPLAAYCRAENGASVANDVIAAATAARDMLLTGNGAAVGARK